MEKIEKIFYFLDSNVQRYSDRSMEERSVCFRYRSRFYTIRHSEIQYISSSLHTVNFHMEDGGIIHCRGKLCDFEDQLKGSSFLLLSPELFCQYEQDNGNEG